MHETCFMIIHDPGMRPGPEGSAIIIILHVTMFSYQVNVLGLTIVTREAVKLMQSQKIEEGHICNLCRSVESPSNQMFPKFNFTVIYNMNISLKTTCRLERKYKKKQKKIF